VSGLFRTDLRNEFRSYQGKTLFKDIMAGLTVTAVALPLALAFGASSGADAAAGLVTAIIAGLVIGSLSGAYYQISGPTGAMAAILISIIARHQMRGVFIATALAGILLLLAGLLHLGRLASFLPAPVITGFTSGIAIIIAVGQLGQFLGIELHGESAVARLASLFRPGWQPDPATVGLALFVVLLMIFFPKKWNAVMPASLLGIMLATLIASLSGLDVPMVGAIPRTLLPQARLTVSSMAGIQWQEITALAAPAVSIALLGMIESLLCGASAGRMTGVPLNSDQELVAQGIGNILLPFFGGIPATAAIARTSVAIKSGARTRLTGIIHALGLLLSMFLLAPFMSQIPLAALAGVLMVTAWRMNEWHAIQFMVKRRFKGAIIKFSVTMAATVIFDLTVAILIGFSVALILLVRLLSHLEINYDRVDMSRIRSDVPDLIHHYSNAQVVYITGPLVFANVASIRQILASIPQDCDTVLFSMRGVSHVDISGAQALSDLLAGCRQRGIILMLCGLPEQTMRMMERSGICDLIGRDRFYWSVEQALIEGRPLPVPGCTREPALAEADELLTAGF
jgi:SulP family sulfate permease